MSWYLYKDSSMPLHSPRAIAVCAWPLNEAPKNNNNAHWVSVRFFIIWLNFGWFFSVSSGVESCKKLLYFSFVFWVIN